MQGLYPGCVDPLKTTVTVTVDASDGIDLTTVSAARIFFRFTDDTETSLDATLANATATSIDVIRVHEASDIPEGSEGRARVWAELDIPSSAQPLRTSSHSVPILQRGVE